MRLIAGIGVAALAAIAGAAAARSSPSSHAAPLTARPRARVLPDTKVAVRTILRSHGLPADGTRVAVPHRDRRVFVDAQNGVALVSVHDEAMPARTTDGGRVWRIDGPGLFTEGAADAAAVVDDLDAEDASTFYAYGGGNVVDITSDGGRIWRQALFQGLQVSVSPVAKGLAAYVDQSNSTGTQGLTIQFYTTNGGRSWRVIKGFDF